MPNQRSILAAATNAKNLELLCQVLEKEGYAVIGADSLEGIDAAFLENRNIALALLDLAGFDRRVWERRHLKSDFLRVRQACLKKKHLT
jgi:DNA-binding response OmpR family regulator